MRSEGVCKNSEVTQAVLTLCLHQSSVVYFGKSWYQPLRRTATRLHSTAFAYETREWDDFRIL